MAEIRTYGCWNKPTLDTYLVQDGHFIEPVISGEIGEKFDYKLTPRFVEIKNPMSRGCHYDKRDEDWRCRGCNQGRAIGMTPNG